MAQTFDTGLSLSQRATLRAAVIARLAPLLRPTGYLVAVKEVACVTDTARFIEDEAAAEFLGLVDGGAPVVGIALGKGTGRGTGMAGPHREKVIEVHVYALSNNARSRMARLAQDPASLGANTLDPGIETMLEHVDELLDGFQVKDAAGSIHGLDFVDEEQLIVDPSVTIWRARYEVATERNRKRGKGVTQHITELRARQLEAMAATADENPFTVLSWDPDLRLLTFDDDLPAEVVAGDRLTLVKADATQQLLYVTDVPAAAVVELAAAPDVAPVAGDLAYRTQNPLSDALSTL